MNLKQALRESDFTIAEIEHNGYYTMVDCSSGDGMCWMTCRVGQEFPHSREKVSFLEAQKEVIRLGLDTDEWYPVYDIE